MGPSKPERSDAARAARSGAESGAADPHGHAHPQPHEHPHDHPHVHPHPDPRPEPHPHEHAAPHRLERVRRLGDGLAQRAAGLGPARLALVALFLYLATGTYVVLADQQGVVLVFGKVRAPRVAPGIHWTLPYPIGRVEKLKVLETKRLTVGIEPPDQVLGRGAADARGQLLTGDQNIINIRLAVQYRVEDPVLYLFAARDVTAVLARSVEASLASVVVRRNVDDLLTREKVAVQNEVQTGAQELLHPFGVSLSSVSIESIGPPEEVLEAFRDVASAREDRERIVREAESYSNDLLPRARGEAERMRQEAESYTERKTQEAAGDAARFSKLAGEYRKARDVTSARLFLETMEEVLPRMKKIVVEPGATGVDVDLIQRK